MPEENEVPEDWFVAFSVEFCDDDNVLSTLDFLEWDWNIVGDEEAKQSVSYVVPFHLAN